MMHESAWDSCISPALSANAGRQTGTGNRSVFLEHIEIMVLDNMHDRLCRLVHSGETGADHSPAGKI